MNRAAFLSFHLRVGARLALSRAGMEPPPIDAVQRYGGVLPQQGEIMEAVLKGEEVAK